MSDLISSLRENFGAPPDTTTIKGIGQYAELWIAGEENVESNQLKLACERMMNSLTQAILDTEAELATTGKTHESLAEPVERSLQAYERLREILGDLKTVSGAQQRAEARTLLTEMRDAADFLREAQADLEDWVLEDVLRCPRCGSTERDPCGECGLQLMYLDPAGGTQASDGSVNLPREFADLYSAFLAIRDGKVSLSKLAQALPKVERNVNAFLAAVQAASQQNRESQNLASGEACLEEMKAGTAGLRAALHSRRMTDLQEGWLRLFRGAAQLQEIRRDLLMEFGGEEGRNLAAGEIAAQGGLDGFSGSIE